jgi:hypothetical protein
LPPNIFGGILIKYTPNILWHLNIYLIKNSSSNTINTGLSVIMKLKVLLMTANTLVGILIKYTPDIL